jgi:DNA topoisomerase-1
MYKQKSYKKIFKDKMEREINKEAIYLIIVESPSKCNKIEEFLGCQYHCIASKGHIRKILGLKSIDAKNNFETEYAIIEEKKSHIEAMRKIMCRFQKENIILAMDDDREGEGIAWHICEVFNLDIYKTKRIIFREITKNALVTAISNPTIINMALVNAQQARQILDIIVGYKISPILWKYLYSNKENSLSAGRCQTPALRLIYDKEIEESKKEIKLTYKTIGTFFSKNILFELSREFEKEEEITNFLEKSKNFQHNLSISEKINKEKNPPKPFNTSNLLQTASNVLGISPKETTSLCQQLYQEGHITYIRTDSMKYSRDFILEAKKYITKNYKTEYLGELSLIENKDETNPHEAIRITHIEIENIETDNKRLLSLYKLIWKNTIESCMSEYKYTTQKITITAPFNLTYSKEIEIPIFLGWKKIIDKEPNEQNKETALIFYLDSIQKSLKPFTYNIIKATAFIKGTEKYYTEASLIKKLEDLGIGRPSTFSTIIDTIQERGYVKKIDIEGIKQNVNEYILENREIQMEKMEKIFGKSKNKLVIQPIGILTCEFLIDNFSKLFSYEYTKVLEKELDEIALTKNNKWYQTCEKYKEEIKVLIKNMVIKKPEYNIDEGHILTYEKYGPVIKNKENLKYLPIKKGIEIDLEKLKKGEYNLEDLLEIENRNLGKYENEDMVLKNGKYGCYVEWGENKQSIKNIEKPIENIELKDIIDLFEKEKTSGINILRELTSNLSIRKGKFGAYIYYKRENMKKPQFFNIKKFKESFRFCEKKKLVEWINENYKINETIDE